MCCNGCLKQNKITLRGIYYILDRLNTLKNEHWDKTKQDLMLFYKFIKDPQKCIFSSFFKLKK